MCDMRWSGMCSGGCCCTAIAPQIAAKATVHTRAILEDAMVAEVRHT